MLIFPWTVVYTYESWLCDCKVHVCTYWCPLSGGGVDYGPITCNPLVFSGTDSLECCNIPINDDNLCEDTESFTVSLNTTATASDATLINPVQATVSIIDNDSEFTPKYTVIVVMVNM